MREYHLTRIGRTKGREGCVSLHNILITHPDLTFTRVTGSNWGVGGAREGRGGKGEGKETVRSVQVKEIYQMFVHFYLISVFLCLLWNLHFI